MPTPLGKGMVVDYPEDVHPFTKSNYFSCYYHTPYTPIVLQSITSLFIKYFDGPNPLMETDIIVRF